MCTSSYTQAFPFFLLLSWVCLYWFSCVQRRRCGGSTTYKVQPRRHEGVRQTWRALQRIARLCETCMHRTWTLVLGIGVAFARSNSWNGLVGVSLLPKSLPFHRSCHAQRLFFPRFPLVSEPLTFPSPAGIPVLHSRVLQTNFGRSHPKNSNWEDNIHCAHVQASVLYWEATEAVWLQICPALRVPVPRSFLLEFFFLLLKLYYFTKANFQSQLPHASSSVYQSNEPNARTRRSMTPWGVGSKI